MWMRSISFAVFGLVAANTSGVTPVFANDPAVGEHNGSTAIQTLGLSSLRPMTQTFRGVIASVDQGNGTIKIQRSPDATEDLKVQDGLLFNAVRYGDQVEVTVQDINGATTIVGLTKH